MPMIYKMVFERPLHATPRIYRTKHSRCRSWDRDASKAAKCENADFVGFEDLSDCLPVCLLLHVIWSAACACQELVNYIFGRGVDKLEFSTGGNLEN